jgi:hypothetical protein
MTIVGTHIGRLGAAAAAGQEPREAQSSIRPWYWFGPT